MTEITKEKVKEFKGINKSISKMIRKKNYPVALERVEKAIVDFSPYKEEEQFRSNYTGLFYDHGVCLRHTGDFHGAIEAFGKTKYTISKLEIIETYCFGLEDYAQSMEIMENWDDVGTFRDSPSTELRDFYSQEYYVITRTMAFCFLMTGEIEKANELYEELHCMYYLKEKEKDKIEQIQSELKNKTNGKKILDWFGTNPKLNTDEIKSNREWWDSLDKKWQMQFKEPLDLGSKDDVSDSHTNYFIKSRLFEYDSSYKIKNLGPLKKLKKLKILNLDGCKLKNYNLLKDLTGLEYLNLGSNEIEDIAFTRDLKNLKKLYLDHNEISDIGPLVGLTNIEVLDLSYNKLKSIDPLENLCNLKELSFNGTRTWHSTSESEINIISLKPLSKLENLKNLECVNIGIRDCNEISSLIKLEELKITGADNLVDIKGLKNMSSLKILSLRGIRNSQLEDFSILENMNELIELDLTSTNVINLEFVKGLIKLREIELNFTPVSDISPLKYCENLFLIKFATDEKSKIGLAQGLLNLQKLSNLKRFSGDAINKKEVNSFKKIKPDVNIELDYLR